MVVPVYNEAHRIRTNFPKFLNIRRIDRIIIVDDGSTDGCTQFIKPHTPRVTLVKLSQNTGKTNAIRVSLKWVRTSHVLLLDADLKNLNVEQINRGVRAALSQKNLDMLIFVRTAPGNVASVYSGDRVVKTDILQASLDYYHHAKSFQLEAAVNQYCMDNQKSVWWMPITASNTFQMEKRQSILGLTQTTKTIGEIVKLIGWKNYVKQLTVLARHRLQ